MERIPLLRLGIPYAPSSAMSYSAPLMRWRGRRAPSDPHRARLVKRGPSRTRGAELRHQCARSAQRLLHNRERATSIARSRASTLCYSPRCFRRHRPEPSIMASVPAQHAPATQARPSRRQVLRAGVLSGIAVHIAPFGTRAFASLFEDAVLTRAAWNDGALKYRVDGISKVTGEKVFARDIRARDMPHWPQQQAHALTLRVTKADRRYAGFDLSALHPDLEPDRIVTAADLKRDGLDFPSFYGKDMLLGEGETPAYLGQAVAILIYRDFARFRFAKDKLQFNDAVIRYREVTGPLQRDPWGSSRFVRVGGKTPYDEDVFSTAKDGLIFPFYEKHEPVWPKPAADVDFGAQGMHHADGIADELIHPPAEWLVLRRDYATQSGDVAALEPDNANVWYDADKQELHLVVGTQSPQEVAEGVAAMLGTSRIGLKRLFLHPCFTVGYGSKDHTHIPYYGVLAAVYGEGRPVRLANDR